MNDNRTEKEKNVATIAFGRIIIGILATAAAGLLLLGFSASYHYMSEVDAHQIALEHQERQMAQLRIDLEAGKKERLAQYAEITSRLAAISGAQDTSQALINGKLDTLKQMLLDHENNTGTGPGASTDK